MIIEIVITGLFVFLLLFWRCQRRSDAPPGPIPFPLIGNLLQVGMADKKPFVALDKLSQKYGDVMSVRFGSINMLILSTYEAVRDTMNTEAWNGRVWGDSFLDRYMNQRIGIMFTEGEFWKDQRRFAIRHLRDVGFGKQAAMEQKVHEELRELMEGVDNLMGDGHQTVLYMQGFFNLSFLNILWSLIAGVRYKHDHPRLKHMMDIVYKLFKSGSPGSGLANAFPILAKIAPKWTGSEEQVKIYEEIQKFIQETIAEHRTSPTFGQSDDFMDIYLQEVDKTKDDPKSNYTEDQLVMMCLDLFMAGSETTSNTLSFGILYMILNPEIQEKVFKEIAEVVGLNRTPTLNDRSRLPFTEATLMEIQRISNVAAFVVPHQLMDGVTFRDYFIPKDTPVLINLYSINMNKYYWGDPNTFRPERFLDRTNNKVTKPPYFIPFGLGKRICLGESLAKMSLFLYFTTLVQNFKFETVPGHLSPTTEPEVGFTLSPQPYHTVITKRNSQLVFGA